MIEFFPFAFTTIINFVAAAVLAMTITNIMIKINIRDIPNERSSHTKATPKSGGVAIVLGTFYFVLATHLINTPILDYNTYAFLLPAAIVATVGLIDDIFEVSFKPRLLMQIILAIFVVTLGPSLQTISIPLFGTLELGFFGPLLSIFWIVAFMNAFNFMDGLNGLACGCTAIACTFILLLSPSGNYMYYVLLGLLASTIGFLPFNFPKGKIFLGDVGSQFIGFLISVIALKAADAQASTLSFYVIPMLFFPFLYDTLFTLVRRAINGENLFDSHREHLFQILNRLGRTHTQISFLYYTFIILGGFGALIMVNWAEEYHLLFFVPYTALYITYASLTLRKARKQGLLN